MPLFGSNLKDRTTKNSLLKEREREREREKEIPNVQTGFLGIWEKSDFSRLSLSLQSAGGRESAQQDVKVATCMQFFSCLAEKLCTRLVKSRYIIQAKCRNVWSGVRKSECARKRDLDKTKKQEGSPRGENRNTCSQRDD
jgi:hypothetical protein